MAKKRPGPFLGPDHSFPAGDKKHQRLAIGGATRSERAGNIDEKEEECIKRRARKMLDGGSGAKARTGKTKTWKG